MNKVIQLDAHTWIIEEPAVRMYLLEGEEKALLIDSGMDTHDAKDIAMTLTDKPLELLNTHSDGDHTGSNEQFDRFYMAEEDVAHYRKEHTKEAEILLIRDGDIMDLGGRELELIAIPGHTPGSMGVYDKANRRLFSGDPLQKNSDIFMFGETRNMQLYIDSLTALEKRKDDFDLIYPSHAEYPLDSEAIGECLAGAKKVAAGEVPGEKVKMFGMFDVMKYDTGYTSFLGELEE